MGQKWGKWGWKVALSPAHKRLGSQPAASAPGGNYHAQQRSQPRAQVLGASRGENGGAKARAFDPADTGSIEGRLQVPELTFSRDERRIVDGWPALLTGNCPASHRGGLAPERRMYDGHARRLRSSEVPPLPAGFAASPARTVACSHSILQWHKSDGPAWPGYAGHWYRGNFKVVPSRLSRWSARACCPVTAVSSKARPVAAIRGLSSISSSL